MAEYHCSDPECRSPQRIPDFMLVDVEGKPLAAWCPTCRTQTQWTHNWVSNVDGLDAAADVEPVAQLERDDELPAIHPWPQQMWVKKADGVMEPKATIVLSNMVRFGEDKRPQVPPTMGDAEEAAVTSLIVDALNGGLRPIARHRVERVEQPTSHQLGLIEVSLLAIGFG
jgi:hypothetical protein